MYSFMHPVAELTQANSCRYFIQRLFVEYSWAHSCHAFKIHSSYTFVITSFFFCFIDFFFNPMHATYLDKQIPLMRQSTVEHFTLFSIAISGCRIVVIILVHTQPSLRQTVAASLHPVANYYMPRWTFHEFTHTKKLADTQVAIPFPFPIHIPTHTVYFYLQRITFVVSNTADSPLSLFYFFFIHTASHKPQYHEFIFSSLSCTVDHVSWLYHTHTTLSK